MRMCSNPACHLAGQLQPDDAFYRGRYQCAVCSRAANQINAARMRRRRAQSPFDVDRERHIRLPGEPWRAWLMEQINAAGGINGGGIADTAHRCGTNDRVIYRWLHESAYADLDAVDRALCAFGSPGVLRNLYPWLYETCDECGLTGMHDEKCSDFAPIRRQVGSEAVSEHEQSCDMKPADVCRQNSEEHEAA